MELMMVLSHPSRHHRQEATRAMVAESVRFRLEVSQLKPQLVCNRKAVQFWFTPLYCTSTLPDLWSFDETLQAKVLCLPDRSLMRDTYNLFALKITWANTHFRILHLLRRQTNYLLRTESNTAKGSLLLSGRDLTIFGQPNFGLWPDLLRIFFCRD